VIFSILALLVGFYIGFRSGFKYFYFTTCGKHVKISLTVREIMRWVMIRGRVQEKIVDPKSKDRAYWRKIWSTALSKAKAKQDPRAAMLERYINDAEWVCRKLSLISEADIDREFGG
jgi:hypothetical protein